MFWQNNCKGKSSGTCEHFYRIAQGIMTMTLNCKTIPWHNKRWTTRSQPMFYCGSVLENIHIQKRDTLARAPSRPPQMYQYMLCPKWNTPVRPPKMYQYILCQKLNTLAGAPLRPPKMYQYMLDQKWDIPLRPPKMYQYILTSHRDDSHTFHANTNSQVLAK